MLTIQPTWKQPGSTYALHHPNEIINLLNSGDHAVLASNIMQNNNLVVLTLDDMDNDLIMFHHFTQIGGTIRIKDPKIVALNGFGPLATVVRFKQAEDLFGYIVERDAPSSADLESFGNASEFKNLKCKDKNMKYFRNIMLIPPYLATAFLSISSRKPEDLACIANAAAENFKNEHGGHSDFNEKNLKVIKL